jgi:arylsulfatase A-like enzyme
LIGALRSAGIRTVLVCDSHALVESPRAEFAAFDQVVEIDRTDGDSTAGVFDAAKEWLQREAGKGRFLLFMDCHGAHPPWYPPATSDDTDADLEENETDPEILGDADDSGQIDSSTARESAEPDDAANRARQTYAAVVAHLDSELGSFLDFVRGRPEWEQSLVVITSDCGANLEGQHAATPDRTFLHEGRTHVPLLVRMPGVHDPASRSPALVQPVDLMPTVCDAVGVAVPSEVPGRSLLPIVRLQTRSVRDHALMADAGRGWSIRTLAWHLILPIPEMGSETPADPQLFVKPDDRWNRNDVAKQFADVSEQLERTVRQRMQPSLPPMSLEGVA